MADDDTEQPDAEEAEVEVTHADGTVETVTGVLPLSASLPTHKDDLAALAIERGTPSYVAWAMTVPELTDKLKGSDDA